MVKLYHFTDRVGKVGIYSDKLIRATDAGDGLGKVVRFIELDRVIEKFDLIKIIKHQKKEQSKAMRKLQFWFWFQSKELPGGTRKVTEKGLPIIWVCPGDVPLRETPRRKNCEKIYYHYTNQADRDAILKSGRIDPKCDWSMLNFGGYVNFTDVEPTESKSEIAWHMFGAKNPTIEYLDRIEYWFEFSGAQLPWLRRLKKDGRRLWGSSEPVHKSVPEFHCYQWEELIEELNRLEMNAKPRPKGFKALKMPKYKKPRSFKNVDPNI